MIWRVLAILLALGISAANAQEGQAIGGFCPLGGCTYTGDILVPAGSATNPGVAVGVTGTGLYSVSTTGLGGSVSGSTKFDWGVTLASQWSFVGGITSSGSITATGGNFLFGNVTNTRLFAPATGVVQFGNGPDAAAPQAASLFFQNVATGTSNTAGANATIQYSLSTGTGVAGLGNFLSGFSGVSGAQTVTFTNSSANVSLAAQPYVPGQSGQFSTTGALPTNFATATTYFVCSTGLGTGAFQVSATYSGGSCGSIITAGSAGSGTQTWTPNLTTQNPGSLVAQFGPSALTGSQNIPAFSMTQVWNTSAVVDAAFKVNVTNIASGAGSLVTDLQVGGSSVFKIDSLGNATANATGSGNATGTLAISNTTSGTAARTSLSVASSNGSANLFALSAGYTSTTDFIANSALFRSSSGLTAGFGIATGAVAPMIFYINDMEVARFPSGGTQFQIASGAALKLGNAYTAGAVTTTGYITLQDSTGTTYKLNACTGC